MDIINFILQLFLFIFSFYLFYLSSTVFLYLDNLNDIPEEVSKAITFIQIFLFVSLLIEFISLVLIVLGYEIF